MLPRRLSHALSRWIRQRGGDLFDNEEVLTVSALQSFRFSGLDAFTPSSSLCSSTCFPGHRRDRIGATRSSSSSCWAGLALLPRSGRQGVCHRGAQDMAETQRLRAVVHAEHRGLRRPRSSANGHRKLSNQGVSVESRPGRGPCPGPLPPERRGDRADRGSQPQRRDFSQRPDAMVLELTVDPRAYWIYAIRRSTTTACSRPCTAARSTRRLPIAHLINEQEPSWRV